MGGSTRLEILPDGLASASLLLSPGVRQHTLSPLQGQPVVGIFFFFYAAFTPLTSVFSSQAKWTRFLGPSSQGPSHLSYPGVINKLNCHSR